MSASSLVNAVNELAKTFSGQLLAPADPEYEEARKVHNGLVNKRPALIARCLRLADVVKGVHVDLKNRTARAQGGVTWAEFNRETQLHGLATTGGVVSSTGVAVLTLD